MSGSERGRLSGVRAAFSMLRRDDLQDGLEEMVTGVGQDKTSRVWLVDRWPVDG